MIPDQLLVSTGELLMPVRARRRFSVFWILLMGLIATSQPNAVLAAPEGVSTATLLVAGKGFGNCTLGASPEEFAAALGRPDAQDATHAEFRRRGVEIVIKDNKVVLVVLYYRSKKFMTFDGHAPPGIGMWSTLSDVYRAYGEPSRLGDSIVSEFGPMPGAHEFSLEYGHKGISFTFYDNELADIRIVPVKK